MAYEFISTLIKLSLQGIKLTFLRPKYMKYIFLLVYIFDHMKLLYNLKDEDRNNIR